MIDKKAVEEMRNEELLRAYAWGLHSETRAEILKRMTPRPLPTREELMVRVEEIPYGAGNWRHHFWKGAEWMYERITGSKLEEGR